MASVTARVRNLIGGAALNGAYGSVPRGGKAVALNLNYAARGGSLAPVAARALKARRGAARGITKAAAAAAFYATLSNAAVRANPTVANINAAYTANANANALAAAAAAYRTALAYFTTETPLVSGVYGA